VAASIKAVTRLREAAHIAHLQNIVAHFGEGIVLIDPDRTNVWANDAALALHGVKSFGDLGIDVAEFRTRFKLHTRE
jgi:PAS domain-containing protein